MSAFVDFLKLAWAHMLEPPWRHSRQDDAEDGDWSLWVFGWAWATAGLVLGATVAPSIVKWARLSDTPYQDAFVIGVAVFAGFLVQLLGWSLLGLLAVVGKSTSNPDSDSEREPLAFSAPTYVLAFGCVMLLVVALWPLAGVGYGLYRYFTWIGAGQRTVTVAFVGGLLVKTFLIPLIKGLVTGALFRWFVQWLRGGKVKARGA